MSQTDIEKAASKGEPIPQDLKPYDTMLYYMLTGLYARYQARLINKEEAKQQKKVIMNTYKSVKDDYEQYTSICKMYQEEIHSKY